MRSIDVQTIIPKVKELIMASCYDLGETLIERLRRAIREEESPLGKDVLSQIVKNDEIARDEFVPVCQDTGIVVVFLEVGTDVHLKGDIYEAINQSIREGYEEGYLRKSVVAHPLKRTNTNDNTPAIIHTKLVPGDTIHLHIAPKGGGSENVSLVKMLTPADGKEGIKKLVLDTVYEAGGKPCPPIIIGLGIGGNLEKSALIAKEAALRELDDVTEDPDDRAFEEELLEAVNNLGIGPMGFGGTTTCLAVKINTYPCHMASLPVAINIQCHSARHKSITI